MKYEFNGSEIVESVEAGISRLLDLLYDAVVNGIPGPPDGTAGNSRRSDASGERSSKSQLEGQIDALIFWHTMAAASTGFVTGVPGLAALPVTMPADVTATLAIQLRLVTAIASLCGYDLRDYRVRYLCYICLCGNAASNVLKDMGIKAGTRFAEQGLERVSGKMLAKINAMVGFRLMTKFGQTGVVNLGKAIPLVGGAIGAAFDGTTTGSAGKVAKKIFFLRDTTACSA